MSSGERGERPVRGLRGVHRRIGPGLLLLLLTVAAAIGSLLPQTAPPGNGVDLGLHLIFYAALTVATRGVVKRLWLVAPLVFLYSAALEGLQTLVPGRTGSVDDLIANAIGVACGLLIAALWTRGRHSAARSFSFLAGPSAVRVPVTTVAPQPHERLTRPRTGKGA